MLCTITYIVHVVVNPTTIQSRPWQSLFDYGDGNLIESRYLLLLIFPLTIHYYPTTSCLLGCDAQRISRLIADWTLTWPPNRMSLDIKASHKNRHLFFVEINADECCLVNLYIYLYMHQLLNTMWCKKACLYYCNHTCITTTNFLCCEWVIIV